MIIMEKKQRVFELIDLGYHITEIRKIIKAEYGKSISYSTIAEYRKYHTEKVDYKKAASQLLSLFLDLSQSSDINRDWDEKIKLHLDFKQMELLKEAINL